MISGRAWAFAAAAILINSTKIMKATLLGAKAGAELL
jgi:hypothetical protein